MSAQPAENLAADPAWDNVLKMPPRVEGANPILDAPVTDVAYEPPPDVILNRPKAKRQRKAKTPGKKRGRPATAKAPVETPTPPPAPTPQTLLATPPHGDALPKFNSENVFTLMTIIWLVVGFGSGVGACYLMWGPVL